VPGGRGPVQHLELTRDIAQRSIRSTARRSPCRRLPAHGGRARDGARRSYVKMSKSALAPARRGAARPGRDVRRRSCAPTDSNLAACWSFDAHTGRRAIFLRRRTCRSALGYRAMQATFYERTATERAIRMASTRTGLESWWREIFFRTVAAGSTAPRRAGARRRLAHLHRRMSSPIHAAHHRGRLVERHGERLRVERIEPLACRASVRDAGTDVLAPARSRLIQQMRQPSERILQQAVTDRFLRRRLILYASCAPAIRPA